MNNHRQQSSKYTDRIDDSVQRYGGVENGAHQRHHSSHAVVTDKQLERKMNHKNRGKTCGHVAT